MSEIQVIDPALGSQVPSAEEMGQRKALADELFVLQNKSKGAILDKEYVDQCAMMAMQGLLLHRWSTQEGAMLAFKSYEIARAMLAESKK